MGQPGISGVLHAAGPIILVTLACFPLGASLFIKKYGSAWQVEKWAGKPKPLLLTFAVLISFSAWLLLGLALWSIGAAISPLALSAVSLFIFAMTTSLLVGLAALFVPVGIGVREGIMVLILSARIPASEALAVAAVSRLLIILSEIIAAMISIRLGPESGAAKVRQLIS
jgi:hypothetical protein